MRLLRSRMDPEKPCLVMELEQPEENGQEKLEGRWHYGADRLELTLRKSFGGDIQGVHILPTVHTDGRTYTVPAGTQLFFRSCQIILPSLLIRSVSRISRRSVPWNRLP